MQLQLALDVLEKSAFDGQFGEAIDTAEKLIQEVHKIKYNPTKIVTSKGEEIEVILLSDLDRIIKEVERDFIYE